LSDHVEDVLSELARLAADLGPALTPAGHTEFLQSNTHAVRDLFRRPPARWRWLTRTASA
jgi:hypothetical protein